MKYKIGGDGRVSASAKHVILDEEEKVGIWVQPGAITAAYRLQDQWKALRRESLVAVATELQKPLEELTDEERDTADFSINEDLIESVSKVMRSCFVRWDEGLVEFDGKPAKPQDVIDDGQTALDIWIAYICEHELPTVWRIMDVAAGRARELEGNSSRPSAGTGAMEEAPQPVGGPELTASSAQPTAVPEQPAPSAGTSEVPASPA